MLRKGILTFDKLFTLNINEDQGCLHNSKELHAKLNITLILGCEPTNPFETITYKVSARQLPR